MQWFINLSTQKKLLASSGVSILMLCLVSYFAFSNLKHSNNAITFLYEDNFKKTVLINKLRYDHTQFRQNLMRMMLQHNGTYPAHLETTNDELLNSISEHIVEIERLSLDKPDRIAIIKQFNGIRQQFMETRTQEIIPAIRAGNIAKALNLFVNVQDPRASKMEILISKLVSDIVHDVSFSVAAADEQYQSALVKFSWIVLIAIAIAVAFTLMLSHLLATPLNSLARASALIAKGNLSIDLPPTQRTDESGQLHNAFHSMLTVLRSSMQQIREGANVLGSAASEITASSVQVSAGSAQTAAAISQTTATVEEVKQTAQLSADKASYVQDSAKQSAKAGAAGKKAMSETLESMELIQQQMTATADSVVHLSEQTQAISDVIASVNELAEQSKILAVNAALEAAKAGEHGKGFAVVALEVKSLADQSKQATVQVRSILGDIHKATNRAVAATELGSRSVETGAKLTRTTHTSIDELMSYLDEAVNAAIQIAASAQQQLVGMDQVVSAMQSIEQASSQNAASTRQVEDAAENLQDLGKKLILCVDEYHIQS